MNTASFAQYVDQTKIAANTVTTTFRSSCQQMLESGQEAHSLAIGHTQSNSQRLFSTLEALAKSPDAASASRICTSFVTDGARAQAEQLAEWRRILFSAYKKGCAPMLDALSSGKPVAESQEI